MFKILTDGCEPKRGSKHSACVDLFASEDVVIGAGETKLVGLGVCIDLDLDLSVDAILDYNNVIKMDRDSEYLNSPRYKMNKYYFMKSHYLQLMLRSSLGKKGLILPNGVGVIDLDYKDEIKMIIHNPLTLINILPTIYSTVKNFFKVVVNIDSAAFKLDGGYLIKKGDKIGQITLLEHKAYLFGIDTDEERNGGFGSTGK